MIKGIHHISMKCRPEQMEKVRAFYCGMLGLPVFAEWETAKKPLICGWKIR